MDRFQHRSTFLKAMRYDADACAELVDLLWDDPDQLIEVGKRLTGKRCVRTTVAFESSTDCYVVKRHRERSWRHIVKQWFCMSRAERCWHDSVFLFQHQYPTPRPIAYREDRFGGLRGNSYYVYEYVSGITLRDIAAPMKNQRLLRRYIRQLCEIWRLHWHMDVNLHDGHPDNFVVAPSGKIWVIDLDKLQYLAGLPAVVKKQRLMKSFMRTLHGVFGDFRMIQYGERKMTEILKISNGVNQAA